MKLLPFRFIWSVDFSNHHSMAGSHNDCPCSHTNKHTETLLTYTSPHLCISTSISRFAQSYSTHYQRTPHHGSLQISNIVHIFIIIVFTITLIIFLTTLRCKITHFNLHLHNDGSINSNLCKWRRRVDESSFDRPTPFWWFEQIPAFWSSESTD